MSSRSRVAILLLALTGAGFAGASAWVHYRILTDPTYISPCDINASFNCSQVYLSTYGSVAGVPVALGGLAWFALVALIAAFSRQVSPAQKARSRGGSEIGGATYIFALSIVGLASILYLGYVSFFVLETGCLLCMGTYACVIGIFLISGAASSGGLAQVPARLPADLRAAFAAPTTFLVAVLYLVFTGSAVAFFPRELAPGQSAAQAPAPTGDVEAAFRQAWLAQPRVDLGIDPEGAQVLIVKFLDYQCPSCRAAHLTYEPILDRYAVSHPGAVREVVKDYPLNSRCNFTMTTALHEAACEEAVLVRLARDRGQAGEVIDWLFSLPNQTAVTPAQIRAEAERRFGVTNFDRVYQEKLPAIRRDVADGAALNVNSTPTYFVNGVRAQTSEGWLAAPLMDLAIRIELERVAGQ
jgi:uncharacterized membrane protein/protein-disulfide isomerase